MLCAAAEGMMISKANYLESSFGENTNFTSLEEAVNETRARVRFLVKFTKSSPKSYVTKDSRDVAWKISKCYFDWKQWRPDIATVLCDEGYPEALLVIIKNTATKITTGKDDAVYKLFRNLLGSACNFSESTEFQQQLAKLGAIDVIMAFLAQKKDVPSKQAKSDDTNESYYLVKISLQMMLNILRTAAFGNDFMKAGAMNIFANFMDVSDEDVKCMASLCLLRLLSTRTPVPKFVDDKNVTLLFMKTLSTELKYQDNNRREFKIPIEALVEGLIFIGQNEGNMRKLLQNGVVSSSVCELLNSSSETTQLRGVDLFLALFADRQKLSRTALTSEEFKMIWKKISAMNSSSIETMPVLKAKKVLSNIKQLRNDPADESSSEHDSATPAQSPATIIDPNNNHPPSEQSRKNNESNESTPLQQQPELNNNKKEEFKDNDGIFQLEEAMSETRLRVNFLVKLNELSPTSLICPESSMVIRLLNDSYSAWDSQWRSKIVQVLLQEKYPDIALTFAAFLLKQNVESSESAAFQMILNLYLHVSNITDAVPECRPPFSKAGFVSFLLGYLNKIDPTKQKSANADDLVQKSIVILYNLSRSLELKPYFLENDAAPILSRFLNSSNLLLVVSLCLAHVISDTPEAAKMVDEKGIIKSIMELAIIATGEAIRKAYVSGVGLFGLDELVTGLRLFAASDSNKKTLMNSGAIDLIAELFASKRSSEQLNGMQLMWALCYEASARSAIRAEQEGVMKPLRNLTLSEDAEVKKCAKRTLNFIEKWEKTVSDGIAAIVGKDISNRKQDGGHVFISYSWKQQAIVVRIKTMLVNKGYRVSMDAGEAIEKMAQAVENASLVMICFSNSYKISNSCRAEAQYAHILSKPIIPVNMESNYFPDGWLGIFVRGKKIVDMSLEKCPFEEAFDQLVREVEATIASSEHATNGHSTNGHSRKSPGEIIQQSSSVQRTASKEGERLVPNNHTSAIANWSKVDVKKWLQQEKLLQKFGPKMEEFDGEKLTMLLQIEKKAPEYYYTVVTKHFNEPLPNMLQLFSALSRLSFNSSVPSSES